MECGMAEEAILNLKTGAMSLQELARYYLSQRSTVRAAALMIKLVKTEPTPENLELLADIYMEQGLFDDAAALYLRVVKSGTKMEPLMQ
jgi:tetratricopeptide (TPR) repeat protein